MSGRARGEGFTLMANTNQIGMYPSRVKFFHINVPPRKLDSVSSLSTLPDSSSGNKLCSSFFALSTEHILIIRARTMIYVYVMRAHGSSEGYFTEELEKVRKVRDK